MTLEIDLIAAIYDCIIEPSGWDEVVNRIVEATKSVSGALFIRRAAAPEVSASRNIDLSYADAFVQHYYEINPLNASGAAIPPGVEPAEWHLLETLAPHLQRAAAIHDLLSQTRATIGSLGAAVSAAGFAVFLLMEDCRVLFANARAEDLLRRGITLRCEHGRVAAATPALTHRLHTLARQAARPGRIESEIGSTVELPRGENHPPLLAHVIPLAAKRAAAVFDTDRPVAAVFVVDPAADFGGEIKRFAARFGLTPAETRVLGEIVRGNGLQAAAVQLSITVATAHTHAIRIFAKTGTRRQAELIRRFFETSLPGSPSTA